MALHARPWLPTRAAHSEPTTNSLQLKPLANHMPVVASAAHSEPGPSSTGNLEPAPDQYRVAALARTLTATAVVYQLAYGLHSARAEDRPWKPRRHYMRMHERFSDTWAEELVEVQETEREKEVEACRTAELLRKKQMEEDQRRLEEQEAAMRQRAEKILAAQQTGKAGSGLPFSINVGGKDLAPVVVWGGMFLALAWVYKTQIADRFRKQQRKQGRWVRDRSLGGKLVWVESPVDSENSWLPSSSSSESASSSSSPRFVSDEDFQKLASFASAARKASSTASSSGTYVPPPWWNPAPRGYVSDFTKASRQQEASHVLTRLEQSKVKGADYDVADIVLLRRLCQEGGVSVKPKTTGGRDSIFRAGVEAAAAAAQSSDTSSIGDVQPIRFVCSLADYLGVEEDRAVDAISAVAAGQARNRLIEAVTAGKQDREVDTINAMDALRNLITFFPVLEPEGCKYADMVSSSLRDRSSQLEREKLLMLLAMLDPRNVYCLAVAAQLLGFEPQSAIQLVSSSFQALEEQKAQEAQERAAAAAAAAQSTAEAEGPDKAAIEAAGIAATRAALATSDTVLQAAVKAAETASTAAASLGTGFGAPAQPAALNNTAGTSGSEAAGGSGQADPSGLSPPGAGGFSGGGQP